MKSIYGLREVPGGLIRYVGITNGNLLIRLINHLHEAKQTGCRSNKSKWLAGAGRSPGTYVDICRLEVCEDRDVIWREQYWIEGLRNRGYNLLNRADSAKGLNEIEKRYGTRGAVRLTDKEMDKVKMIENSFYMGEIEWYERVASYSY